MPDFPLQWWEFLIVSFAAFRLTQFFVYDSLIGFNPESGSKMSARLDAFAYDEEGKDRGFVRGKIGDLLVCPWCLGFWLSALTYLAYVLAADRWSGYALAVHGIGAFAVAGAQGFITNRTD